MIRDFFAAIVFSLSGDAGGACLYQVDFINDPASIADGNYASVRKIEVAQLSNGDTVSLDFAEANCVLDGRDRNPSSAQEERESEAYEAAVN